MASLSVAKAASDPKVNPATADAHGAAVAADTAVADAQVRKDEMEGRIAGGQAPTQSIKAPNRNQDEGKEPLDGGLGNM